MSRRNLQRVTALLGLVPVITGLLTMMGVDDPLYAATHLPRDGTLDSNLRFFGGIWLGLGLCVLWMLPRIERETALFRAFWLMIFLGGIGRVISLIAVGAPHAPFVALIALELIGPPLCVWWQRRVAQTCEGDRIARRGDLLRCARVAR
ncbi:MAG: DUF4345 domain-containing protein [Burkholderiales bacterium]|nr:DUF4345 domain-containing protein [Burkholderiales bacterium]